MTVPKQILIQDLDERCVAHLESRAAEHGRSLSDEARSVLEEAVLLDTSTAQDRILRARNRLHVRKTDEASAAAGLRVKEGILVFSGRATGDIAGVIEEERRRRQERLLGWKAE